MSRDGGMAKLISLGLKCPNDHVGVFEVVLDMFLTSPKGRPASSLVAGRLQYLLERVSDG